MSSPVTLALALFLLLPSGSPAQMQLSVSNPTNVATVGDRIDLRVLIRSSLGFDRLSVSFPPGEAELIGQQSFPVKKTQDIFSMEQVITIAFFKTGTYRIGPFTADLFSGDERIGTAASGPLDITIRSLLNEHDRDIRPLKPPLPLGGNPWFGVKFLLRLLIVPLLVVLAWILKRKKTAAPSAPPLLPPLAEFRSGWIRLRAQRRDRPDQFKPFFITLSQLLKRYLGRHYRFNAEELTSWETIGRLRQAEHSVEVNEWIRTILVAADLVKFAKWIPLPETVAEMQVTVERLLQEYQRRETTAPDQRHDQAGA